MLQFIMGLLIGGSVGLFTTALCVVNKTDGGNRK